MTRSRSDVLAEMRALREFIRSDPCASWAVDRLARLRWTLVIIRRQRHG